MLEHGFRSSLEIKVVSNYYAFITPFQVQNIFVIQDCVNVSSHYPFWTHMHILGQYHTNPNAKTRNMRPAKNFISHLANINSHSIINTYLSIKTIASTFALLRDLCLYKTQWRIQVKVLHSWRQYTPKSGETLKMILSDSTISYYVNYLKSYTLYELNKLIWFCLNF